MLTVLDFFVFLWNFIFLSIIRPLVKKKEKKNLLDCILKLFI